MSKRRTSRARRPVGPAANSPTEAERAAVLARAGKLHNAGDLQAAAALYSELLALDPGNHRALFLLGLVAHQQGEHANARSHFARLMLVADHVADYHLWFSRILCALGESQPALVEARRARELAPELTDAARAESQLLRQLGRTAEALPVLHAAVAAKPDDAPLQASLGETYLALGEASLARAALERALERQPDFWEAWINLGLALQTEGNFEACTLAFEQALRLAPDSPEAHFNFGASLESRNVLEPALIHMRRAVALQPARGKWQSALAAVLSEVGEVHEALSLYRSGLALQPHPREHSSLVALLQYLPDNAQQRLHEARSWAARYAPEPQERDARGAAARPARRAREPMRVGFISADFRQHSVSYFFEPLLAALDPSRVAVSCYANSNASDAVTQRVALRARMRSVVGLSDAQVADQIRADDIDILVDLSGHTLGHRLSVFAHAPAPVQVAYLGYPGTTGVPAIQWRLTDARVDPQPFADQWYSERLHRLPGAFCCFQPPATAPELSALPAATRGHITFGSLNKYMKVTDHVLRAWARILGSVPDSRLILQSRIFSDAGTCQRVRRRFAERGVAAERLDLYGLMPLSEHLRLYEQVDVGLDTFPWNGHTTTCLALHMGVPVLTLAGDFGASRMVLSVLTAAGLEDWVAPDEAAYVAAAQRWAAEPRVLAELRAGLREQLARSALCDAASFARGMEDAYEALLRAAGGS